MLSCLDNQKGARKLLVDLLYKKAYCLCIPDPQLINSYFSQVHPSWVQKFLLSKNTLELSVIPTFMLIFVKNKSLTFDQNKRLLELLQVLIAQAELDTIEQLFFDNSIKQMAWAYYILSELVKFTLDNFANPDKSSRMIAMATCIELLFDRASVLTMTKFCLNTKNTGFNVIKKLFYVIAYETLHSSQIIYLSTMSKRIIDKITHFGLETLIFQTEHNGFSFIWHALGTWLQIVFERGDPNQVKIKHYTQLINSVLRKINAEKLSSILLENETKGYSIVLRYIFFRWFKLNIFHRELAEAFNFFNLWCKKLFSPLTIQQIELILDNFPVLLTNDFKLSNNDRQQLIRDFFAYLFEFCRLQPQEIGILKELQGRLESRFFPSNKIVKFFRQVKAHCHFFYSANFRSSINKEDKILLDESIDLLSPEYARLNAHYSTVSR